MNLPCLEKRQRMERRDEALFTGSFPAPAPTHGVTPVGLFTFQADSIVCLAEIGTN